jgi:hypothetical protein
MTVTNEEQQGLVTEIEQKAVELKFYGFEYDEIDTLLKEEFADIAPASKTLKNWFYKGGRLFSYYEKYNKEQSEINIKEASALWKGHAKNAMRAVLKIMQKGSSDSVKLSASQEVLGRAYGSIPKIVYQQENRSILDDLLKEIGIIENESGTTKKTE